MLDSGSRRTIRLLLLGVAVVGSNSLALSPVLADVAAELGTGPVEVARASAAYGAATALAALGLGGLIDRVGARRVLVGGLLVLALAMVGSAVATHWAALAAAQALAGAAAGAALPAIYALAAALAPPGRSAEVMGKVITGWSVSMVAGVPLAALIASVASWRASFAALGLLLVVAAWRLARGALPATPPAASRVGLRVAASSPGVRPMLLVCLLFMTAFYGVYAYLGDHARRELGLSTAEAGLIVLAYGAGFGLAALGDRVVDRIGAARLHPWVLATVAAVYIAMMPAVAAFGPLLAVSAAWGLANHFGLNILVLRLAAAAPEGRGAVLALNSAVSYLGALLGAGLFGPIYEALGFNAIGTVAAGCSAVAALVAVHGRIAAARIAHELKPGAAV